jgi:hypothetical protein
VKVDFIYRAAVDFGFNFSQTLKDPLGRAGHGGGKQGQQAVDLAQMTAVGLVTMPVGMVIIMGRC